MYIVSRKFTTSTSTTTPGPVGIESFADWAPAPMRDPANSRRPRESRDPKNANVTQPTQPNSKCYGKWMINDDNI